MHQITNIVTEHHAVSVEQCGGVESPIYRNESEHGLPESTLT